MNDRGFFELRDARSVVLFAKVGKIRRRMAALNEKVDPLGERFVAQPESETTIDSGGSSANHAEHHIQAQDLL